MKDSDDCGAVVATPGVKVECKTRRFAIDEPNETIYRAEVLNRALKRELLELEEEISRISKKVGVVPPNIKKNRNTGFGNQDEESDDDDDLPPWLADYKRYQAEEESSGIWYTQKHNDAPGACFSALSAMHPLLMSTVDYKNVGAEKSNDVRHQVKSGKSRDSPSHKKYSKAMRSSLPAMTSIDCKQKLSVLPIDPVYSSISERSLNLVASSSTNRTLVSRITNWSLSKLNSSKKDDFWSEDMKGKQYSKSTTRLQSEYNSNNNNGIFCTPPTSSFFMASSQDGSRQSMQSMNTTSCGSEWNTAPQYSSSYVTATENGGSSSNNNTLITPSETPDLQMLPRDSLTDSNRSSNSFHSNDDINSNNGEPEQSCSRDDESRYHTGSAQQFDIDDNEQDEEPVFYSNNQWEMDDASTPSMDMSFNDADRTPSTDNFVIFHKMVCPEIRIQRYSTEISEGFVSPSFESDASDLNDDCQTTLTCMTVATEKAEERSNSSESCSLVDCSETIGHVSDEDLASLLTQEITIACPGADCEHSATEIDEPPDNECLDVNENTSMESVSLLGKDTSSDSNDNHTSSPKVNNPSAITETANSLGISTSDCTADSQQCNSPDPHSLETMDETPNKSQCDSTNNNPANPDDNNTLSQYDSIRQQIFQLERDLILLEIDRSDSVDL